MERESRAITPLSRPSQGRGELEEGLAALAGELLAFLVHYTGERQVAEDLAQDVLAHALGSLDQLREGRALKGWLFRIAINRFNDHLRRRLPATDRGDLLENPGPYWNFHPERVALTNELDAHLRRELALLPERQRTVLMLHGIDGLDQSQIANMLGISPAAVKMSLFHGRERMRRRLALYLGRSLQRRDHKR